jgi:hypothetical protein
VVPPVLLGAVFGAVQGFKGGEEAGVLSAPPPKLPSGRDAVLPVQPAADQVVKQPEGEAGGWGVREGIVGEESSPEAVGLGLQLN